MAKDAQRCARRRYRVQPTSRPADQPTNRPTDQPTSQPAIRPLWLSAFWQPARRHLPPG
ncbi:TPA: hypothetical protein MB325_000315 [Klebsiella quasipneumoniae subsp. quasipneumoniae]|nr:hypothetical protein [Klebsiella quasipneumoniae subsp. quasipneumoniae]